MAKNISLYILMIFLSQFAIGQSSNAYYGFENCSYNDVNNNYSDAVPSPNINCKCGVRDESLTFTGSESVVFPDLDMLFDDDFTMSFYFSPEIFSTDLMDIVSITTDDCVTDYTMRITYSSVQKTVKVDIKEQSSKRIHLEGVIDDNKCWHHVVLSNKDATYDLYVDEKRTDVQDAANQLALDPTAQFKISGNPCNGQSVTNYKGLFDELKVWDYPLSQTEIFSTNEYPDKIISKDKTIFLGDEFQVEMGNVCSSNFSWSPNTAFETIGALNPNIIPTESNSYVFSLNDNGCNIKDTINIYVVDPDALDCNEILLPRAFTPNNDGLNEEYGISNTFIISQLHSFSIYDRWSKKVFETNEIDTKWDGSFNGTKLNPGLYVYKISYTCQGKKYNKTNSFSLLR